MSGDLGAAAYRGWPAPAAGETCPKCEGCGRIADDDEGTPWTFWLNLPVKSAAAVFLGLVQPVLCPSCHGAGVLPEPR